MSKRAEPKQSINLHTIPDLQEINVQPAIILRPTEIGDAARILEILTADPTIRKRVSVAAKLKTESDVSKEIANYQADAGLIRYTLLKDRNPIGLVSLWRDMGFFGTKPNLDDYGFGYFLDPSERGQGLVTGSLQALIDTATSVLPVRQFIAFCEDDNTDSITILKRLGFEPTDEVHVEPTHGWLERKYVKQSSLY